MALSGSTVWEVRVLDGSDSNGGGFVTGASGTDYSKQASPQYALTGLASAGAGSTLLYASASADMVGNIAKAVSGTNATVGYYQITSVSVGVSITFDRSITTGVGASIVLNIGGALLTMPQMITNWVAGNAGWVRSQATTVLITAKILINFAGGGTNVWNQINGYGSTRGDGGKVTIQANSNFSDRMVDLSSGGTSFSNFILDCNGKAATAGILINVNGCHARNIAIKNCNQISMQLNQNDTMASYCDVTGSTLTGNQQINVSASGGRPVIVYKCSATGGTSGGFVFGPSSIGIECLAANNTGASSDGFLMQPNQGVNMLLRCNSYKNGRDGFRITSQGYQGVIFEGNISYGNTGWQWNYTNGTLPVGIQAFNGNAYDASGSGSLLNFVAGPNDVLLTADPFTNGAGLNFSPNATAGGGAALRGNGYVYPGVGGTSYRDIGMFQHADLPAPVIIAMTQQIFLEEK